MISNITLELGIDMNSDLTEVLAGLNLLFFGEELFSMLVTFDEDFLGFYLPTLDGNYYIIDSDSLNDLAGLGGNSNGIFDIPDVTYEEVITFIETYSDIILSIVNEDNLEVNRETVSLFDGREELNAHLYTLTPTEDDFVELLTRLAQELREDEILYEMIAAQMDDWTLMFLGHSDTREYWNSMIDEMEDDIENIAMSLAQIGLVWRTATYRNQMILQEISFEAGNNTGIIRYEAFRRGTQRTDWFTMTVNDDSVSLAVKNEMTLSGRNAVGDLEFNMTVNQSGPDDFDLSAMIAYDIDFANSSILDIPYGTYDLTVNVEGIVLTGLLEVLAGANGGTDHALTIDIPGNLIVDVLTINIHSSDEPSTIQAPTVRPIDLSELSQIELIMIITELFQGFEEIFGTFNQL
jgi:hypothetical protein